jgi:orotidine-5'-phosphate decarboxylase
MTMPASSALPVKSAKDRIIVALDVDSADDAGRIVAELGTRVGAYKVGLQLFAAAGPEFVKELTAAGHRVFLDLKFHDIPNTVASAAVEAAKLGVWMFNVHAAGGSEMMRETVRRVDEYCDASGAARPLIIAVTVLTSSDDDTLKETGVDAHAEDQVVRLAKLAAGSGLDGVVASAQEARAIRAAITNENFTIVTPGIRPAFATTDDQRRVTSVRAALDNGAEYLVIGRPITRADNMNAAVSDILRETAGQN